MPRKRKAEEQLEKTTLWVHNENFVVDDYREDEEYGAWEDHYQAEVLGVGLSRSKKHSNDAITVPFEAKVGEPLYVLSMTYSDGDSFGIAYNKLFIIHVFRDPDLAAKALAAYESNPDKFTISFEVENGKTLSLSNPGAGYCENIEDVTVDVFALKP